MTCASRSLEKLKLQTVSRHDMTPESATLNQTETLLLNKVGFIDKGTGEHQSNQVWGKDGKCPTLPAVSWKEPIKIIDEK